jgi:hypothetical protein
MVEMRNEYIWLVSLRGRDLSEDLDEGVGKLRLTKILPKVLSHCTLAGYCNIFNTL